VVYADSLITCFVHKTNFVATGNFRITPLTRASVVLFENGNAVDTLVHQSNGKYLSDIVASVNKTYTFRASMANYPDAQGTSHIVANTEILGIDSLSLVTMPYGGGTMQFFRLRVSKNQDEVGFYRMLVLQPRYDYTYDPLTYVVIDSVENYYPVYIDMEYARGIEFTKESTIYINGYQYWHNQYFFTDKFVNSNNQGFIEFPISQYSFKSSNQKLILKLQKISKDFFIYHQSLSLLREGMDIPLFYQPVQTFMNIEGGLGIIGTSIVMPDYFYPAR
jgi:hypothetical protein